ncbi:MAG: alpha-amylase, partial [Deltaproteobacteria bacterium]|nr:alpha-amylase [Deltaproteobacteria bacterium]
MEPPLIYNLFPRLAGHMGQWPAHARRALEMGFNWIFVNPIQYPGFSGSLYAVKDVYRLNPLFVPPGTTDPDQALRHTLDELHRLGLKVMLDLVINHTAKDSPLVAAHPDWFRRDGSGAVVSPSAIDPADTRRVTVWGDLAEVDNAGSPDRQGLWAFWTAAADHYLDLGFDGFRCDAAYKVPRELWEHLIGAARRRRLETVFVAETLGCRLPEVRSLAGAGFDYLLNSSKWWTFDAPWCLEQHEQFGRIAPSIAFPESHDTPRLMAETGGLLAVQKQRYAFAACFSTGLLMPVGYELGFTKKLDVVRTTPADWEQSGIDIGPFVRRVNRLKLGSAVLGAEGQWTMLSRADLPTIVLRKTEAQAQAVVAINKDWHAPQTCLLPPGLAGRMLRPFREDAGPAPLPDRPIELGPAEVVLIVS